MIEWTSASGHWLFKKSAKSPSESDSLFDAAAPLLQGRVTVANFTFSRFVSKLRHVRNPPHVLAIAPPRVPDVENPTLGNHIDDEAGFCRLQSKFLSGAAYSTEDGSGDALIPSNNDAKQGN